MPTELGEIVATSMFTLAGGIVLYASSEISAELFLKPLAGFRKTLGEVGFALVYHAHIIASARYEDAPEKCKEVSQELRRLSARLRADADSIWFYRAFAAIKLVPERKNVSQAACCLIRLSNITGDSGHWELKIDDKETVGKLLSLDLG